MIEYLNRWNSIIIFDLNEKDYVAVTSDPWPVSARQLFVLFFNLSGPPELARPARAGL
jgi:hypothetical protein